jgi:hypothetical protein
MILNTSQVLQLKLGGAVATTELPIYAAWADVRRDSVELLPGANSYASTGTTAVTVLPAASSQFLRQLKYLSAYNSDTAPVDVIVQVLDGATVRRVCLVTLPVGATLEYTPDEGWHAIQFGADLAGVVVDSIADADTVNAPSRNAVFDALALKIATSVLDTDGTLAANSDAKIATQKAVKTYVDNAVTGLWEVKGSTDCSANPNYPSALKGDAYVVSVAGKIGGASGTSVDAGDVYVALLDNAGGTEASVGTSWAHFEHNLAGVTLSAIVPNTVPSAGQLLVGNAGGTAYAPVSASGDVTVASTGAMTLATAQPAVHTWALAQTFTVAPVFTDAPGSRDALKIGPRYCYEALADFASGNVSATVLGTEWGTSASGTGAQLTALVGLTSGNSSGRAVLTLGTTTTGRAAILTATLTHALGAGAAQFVLKGAMESLSDATDTFVQRLGLMDSVSAEPTNGCYFRYTHSVNSGKWECVTRAAGVETATDSGITAVAGTERNWQIKVNAAGTSVEFYIDGTLKQTHSTNIPTARIGFAAAAIRSAGTAAKNALGMDLIYVRIDFTTPRW